MCINLFECVLFYFISEVVFCKQGLVFSELNGYKTAFREGEERIGRAKAGEDKE